MSIRPIDMQIVIPRSMETNKAGHEANPRPDIQSQNFSKEFQRRVDTEQRQVNELFHAEHQTVDKDGRRKQEQEKKKKNKDSGAPAKKPSEGQGRAVEPESRFDFSV